MIFEQDSIVFQILNVLLLEQGCTNTNNTNRNFDALSYRLEADTVIEANNTEIELTNNCICYIPSDVNYMRTTKKEKMIIVHFKVFNYNSNEIECFHPSNCEKYIDLFNKILRCWEEKKTSYKYEATSLLNQIFAEFYQDNRPNDRNKSKIHASVQYIKQNCLKKDFSLQDAEKKSLLSGTYFRKIFKKEFHVSPKQYVINRRMKHATSLIIAGYHTLQEVAELCGYNDYKHFSVEFKKVIGVSPSKYKYKPTTNKQ